MKSRFASRKDKNQPATEQALTAAGYRWWSLHRQGYGVPDLLVLSKTNIPVLLEIKMSGGELTDDEFEFHKEYTGPIDIVYDEQGAIDCMGWWDEHRIDER